MTRRVVTAGSAALVAGTAAVLGLAAAADAWLGSSTPVLVGLAAVWIPQTFVGVRRRMDSKKGS